MQKFWPLCDAASFVQLGSSDLNVNKSYERTNKLQGDNVYQPKVAVHVVIGAPGSHFVHRVLLE